MAWLSKLEAQPIDTCILLFDMYQEPSGPGRRVNTCTLSKRCFPKAPRE